jgi:hypothetical protein
MPTVLRVKDYRFSFFSLEGKEPPDGFRSSELTDILQIVQNNQQLFQERWREYFGYKG